MATTAADGPPDGTPAAQRRRGDSLRGWLTPVNAIIVVATLLALGLRVYYQYTRPGFLLGVTEYDDGPYFGSAVRLVGRVQGWLLVRAAGGREGWVPDPAVAAIGG